MLVQAHFLSPFLPFPFFVWHASADCGGVQVRLVIGGWDLPYTIPVFPCARKFPLPVKVGVPKSGECAFSPNSSVAA
jgi:hypothetical protein